MSYPDNAILRPSQKTFLEAFAGSPLRNAFYLTGGTALAAFHLGHRRSDDLDFFTEGDIPVETVLEFLRSLAMGVPEYQHLFDRRVFLLPAAPEGALKVEFTRYPFARRESGAEVGGIEVDSLRDIVANKLLAMTERREPKDFVDVYCAARHAGAPTIDALVGDAEAKFGVRGVQAMLRSRFLGGAPLSGGLEMVSEIDPDDVSRFFVATARRWVSESIEEDR